MRIPDFLRVGPYTYRIERPDLVDEDNRRVLGQINHLEHTIQIRSGINRVHEEETFFHELLHAVDVFMGTKLEEHQVTLLARGLWMVLKQNGLLKEDESQ